MVQIRAHAINEKSGSAEPFSCERAVGSHDVLVGIEAIVDVMPFSRVNEAIERVRRRDVQVGLGLENPGGLP